MIFHTLWAPVLRSCGVLTYGLAEAAARGRGAGAWELGQGAGRCAAEGTGRAQVAGQGAQARILFNFARDFPGEGQARYAAPPVVKSGSLLAHNQFAPHPPHSGKAF